MAKYIPRALQNTHTHTHTHTQHEDINTHIRIRIYYLHINLRIRPTHICIRMQAGESQKCALKQTPSEMTVHLQQAQSLIMRHATCDFGADEAIAERPVGMAQNFQ